MRLSYCDLSATSAFQTTVSTLLTQEPRLTEDKANREVFRDYLEYNGELRGAMTILEKLQDDYFTLYHKTEPEQWSSNNEIIMTKKAKLADLGYSSLANKISGRELSILQSKINNVNNQNARNGIDKVYRVENPKQVGESDNYTYEIKAYPGKLDVQAKAQRTSDTVLERNRLPTPLEQGSLDLVAYNTAPFEISNYSQEFIRKYADVLKLQMGVDYSFITPGEAAEITKDADNPWSGQKSFFFEGQVYFIAGSITPDDVLHEFVHPVIRSIAKQNRPLFNHLWNKLLATEDGPRIIEEVTKLYPNLSVTADDFKEEVLVRSLAKMQELNSKGLEANATFQKFIGDLLYAIKQWLRDHFGKRIHVSDLNPSTTLDELNKMLEAGQAFELDPTIITDADVVAYKNEYEQSVSELTAKSIDQKALEDLANKYFENVKKYLYDARQRKDLGALAEVLQNKYKTGEFENIVKNLKSYQTQILQDAKVMDDEVELTRQRTVATLNSLGLLGNAVGKIQEGLKELVKDIDDQDNIQRVQYYQDFLKYWGSFAKDARSILERNGVKAEMVEKLVADVDRANEIVEEFYEKAAGETIYKTLKNTADNIKQRGEERMAQLRARGASKEELDKAQAEIKAMELTPEKIQQALKGQLKDIGFLTTYLEAAAYNPDPVVGGLALMVKNAYTEAEVKSQARFNDIVVKIKPLLDRIGYNPNKPGAIGELLGKREKVGHVNPDTGEFEEKDVWMFKNQFTGAQIARERLLYKMRKAREKWELSRSDGDRKALAAIQAEHEQHDRDYFHTQYTPAYYKLWDKLGKDEAGEEAKLRMRDLYDELNALIGDMQRAGVDNALEIAELIESKRREIRQISSLYDIVGNLKTGVDLEIATRLKAFNEAANEVFESQEIPGALQNAYQAFEQKVIDEGKKPGSIGYDERMDKWIQRNTAVKIKEEFWTEMDHIYKAIKDILGTVPAYGTVAKEVTEGYETMRNMIRGNRDEDGQPVGNELSPEKQEKIKHAQEQINAARERVNRDSGLPKHEQDELESIYAKIAKLKGKIPQKDIIRMQQLVNKQESLKLSRIQRVELKSLFNELDELRTREATDHYIDTVNNLLDAIESDTVNDILGDVQIDKMSAEKMKNDTIVQRLMSESQDFKEWYERNHISKVNIDYETNEDYTTWERSYAWNVIKPIESKYYEKTSVKNLAGETITLDRVPGSVYHKRIVKDEYYTKKIEGVTVGNRGDQDWLPKTLAQGAKDNRYIDKDYQRLKDSNSDVYKLLEIVTAEHLKNQEGLHRKNKLYLEFPRFRKQLMERFQSENALQRFIQRIKDFFSTVKDSWDSGFNPSTEMNLVKMDFFDTSETTVPIRGLYDLAIEETSTDVIYSVFRYLYSANQNRELTKVAPITRMVQRVVNNEKKYPLDQKIVGNRTLLFSDKKKSRYLRATAVNNLIQRHIEGVQNKGWGSDNPFIQNMSNLIFKTASGAFLNLNIPSALKNSVGQKFQTAIEASAGKYLNWKEFVSAEGWATAATARYSIEIYKPGPKSIETQIIEIFDPEEDKLRYGFGASITRTPGKDYSADILKRMTDVRKWVQLQANLQTFWAMMMHQKIQTLDGKIIPFTEAWELKNDKIQLKNNIDPAWGITYASDGTQIIGDKFKQKRNEFHNVIANLNGAMSTELRPEADQYLLFRYVSFFRRFLTSMAMNRFGTKRYNFQLGDLKEGFYITFLKLLRDTFKSYGKNLPNATPEEKAAALRLFSEAGMVLMINYLLLPLLFGWDPDDNEKYAKLRAKSGPLPLVGVSEDPSRPFNIGGWFENHLLLHLMQVNSENNQFLFFPGPAGGLNQYKQYMDLRSLAFGPTVTNAFNIVNDSYYLLTDDERAYYKRTTTPYIWGQEGEAKIFNHLAKIVGMTGATIDPALSIRNFQNAQSR